MCRGDLFVFILIYIDDIIIIGNDAFTIHHIKGFLHQHFQIKDLGSLKYFLSIEVAHSKHGIYLSQCKYVLNPLHEFGCARTATSPMEQNIKLIDTDGKLLSDISPYCQFVNHLIYLTIT